VLRAAEAACDAAGERIKALPDPHHIHTSRTVATKGWQDGERRDATRRLAEYVTAARAELRRYADVTKDAPGSQVSVDQR
jgi:hypothetical protein